MCKINKEQKEVLKMKFNKSNIMKKAWSLFNNGAWLSDLEFVFSNGEYREATFAECLKEAWGIEKEMLERQEKIVADAPNSEEVKAWDWACRKLAVDFQNISAVDKVRFVDEIAKEMWSANVWAQAMKAVKLHMKLFV